MVRSCRKRDAIPDVRDLHLSCSRLEVPGTLVAQLTARDFFANQSTRIRVPYQPGIAEIALSVHRARLVLTGTSCRGITWRAAGSSQTDKADLSLFSGSRQRPSPAAWIREGPYAARVR